MKRATAKQVKELHDAAMNLNSANLRYRSLTMINKGIPKYEYQTTADKRKRDPKTLNYHPTKKVSSSQKGRKIEQETTDALVNLRNAKEKYRIAEEKVYK